MAVQFKVGTFTASTDPQSITGVGFEPKLVIILSTLSGGFGAFQGVQYLIAGFGTGPSLGYSVGQKSFWNTVVFFKPKSIAGVRPLEVISDITVGGFSNNLAKIASMDADGFTLDFQQLNAAYTYNYLAIGGDDVTVTYGQANAPTSIGQQAITGLGFEPSLLLFQNGFTGNSNAGTWFGSGWVDNAGRQGVTAFHQVGNDSITPGENDRYQRTTNCIITMDETTGALDGAAEFVSFDSNGFTIEWTTAPAYAAPFRWLAISGVGAHAGALNQPGATGSQDVSGLDVDPGAVLFQSFGAVAGTTVIDHLQYSLGFATPSASGCVWSGDNDNIGSVANRRCVSGQWNDRAIVAATPDTTSSATVEAYASLLSVGTGEFTIDWALVDATSRQTLYLALGDPTDPPEAAPDPPEYDLTIGEETGLNPLLETFRIQETLDAPDVAIFDIESAGSPYTRFSLGDLVFVTENGVRIFGGYVTGLRERGFSGPNGDDLVVEIQATSYEINAQRRVITETFSGGSPTGTVQDALETLVADYYGDVGVTLHPDQQTGPVLPVLTFERVRGDQVNAAIAESVGYLISIDFENQLRAWAPGDIPAPDDYDEDVNPELLTGDIEVEKQFQNGYANKVILVGEGIVVPDHVDSFVGDGAEDTFDLTYKILGPFPYTADGAVGYGVVRYTADNSTESIGGLDSPVGFFWEYDPVALTIRRRAAAPGNAVAFTIQYHGLFEPSATAEDAGEIAQYGLWEHVEHVTTVSDDTSAQELADAILAQKLASKSEIATLYTRGLGFHPGQMMGIESPLRELTGSFLITQVDTSSEAGGQRLVRKITAAKSENNDHDWRKVIQQWSQGSTATTTTEGTSSAATASGAGLGLHATHHQSGGIDPIKLDDLATPDDNTDLNASTSRHGLLLKLNNDSDYFLNGAGSWAIPPTGSGSPGGSDPADIVLTDAYASRPAAATEGRLFLPNNGVYVERDTGAAWAPWGPLYPFTVPVDGDFSWINQGTASVDTTNGGIYLLAPANSGTQLRIRIKSAPATPYTITAAFLPAMIATGPQRVGLCWRQSSDGKLVMAYLLGNANLQTYQIDKFNSPTAGNSTYVTRATPQTGVTFLRIADNGTNRITSYSVDGQHWIQLHSIGRTDFMTADQVGFFASDEGNIQAAAMTLLSWKQA
jgi:hypothetical protein